LRYIARGCRQHFPANNLKAKSGSVNENIVNPAPKGAKYAAGGILQTNVRRDDIEGNLELPVILATY
jgi:hypothetical protein